MSDRYGLVWKKSNESARNARTDGAACCAAGDRGEHHDENEQQRHVGIRDRIVRCPPRAPATTIGPIA